MFSFEFAAKQGTWIALPDEEDVSLTGLPHSENINSKINEQTIEFLQSKLLPVEVEAVRDSFKKFLIQCWASDVRPTKQEDKREQWKLEHVLAVMIAMEQTFIMANPKDPPKRSAVQTELKDVLNYTLTFLQISRRIKWPVEMSEDSQGVKFDKAQKQLFTLVRPTFKKNA